MDTDRITEITEQEQPKESKLLKDVLDRYLKSQVEICEAIIELFKRSENKFN